MYRRRQWVGNGVQLACYALPNLCIGMLVLPAATIVPSLYIKERALVPATVGLILMSARFFDAVADQVIGYLSDLTNSRLPGGRKAWLVLGGMVAAPSVFFLFSPPAHAGALYFGFWSMAVYSAWAILLIPYTAWGTELSRDYNERTRIVTARSIAGQLGTLLFLGTPLLLNALHLAKTTAADLHAASYVALALIVLLPLTIVPCMLVVPQGIAQLKSAPRGLAPTIRSFMKNRPMQIYVCAYFVAETGYGLFATAIFFYIDAYLQSGAQFIYVVLLANVATLLSMPAWKRLCEHVEKKTAWGLSWALQSASLLALVFVPPGPAGLVPAAVLITVNSVFAAAALVVAPSILGDIVDYDTWKTGGYRAGNYFALYSLGIKMVTAVGGGLAFILLGWFHYNVVSPATNGAAANRGMLFVLAVAPALLRLLALVVLRLYPLGRHRQRVIRMSLERRERRAAARQPTERLAAEGAG